MWSNSLCILFVFPQYSIATVTSIISVSGIWHALCHILAHIAKSNGIWHTSQCVALSSPSSKVSIVKCLSAQEALVWINDAISDTEHILKSLWNQTDC